MSDSTTFEAKADILGSFWIQYKSDPEYADFISYNDLGLPLAYALSSEIIELTPKAKLFIEETFDLLLGALQIEDEGFESLEDLLLD